MTAPRDQPPLAGRVQWAAGALLAWLALFVLPVWPAVLWPLAFLLTLVWLALGG